MPRTITRGLVIFLTGLFVSAPIFPQTLEKQKADAVRRANLFTQRLRRTQDLHPLLKDFFISDFLDQIQRDRGFNVLVLLESDLRLTPDLNRRYYLAIQNWFYLSWLYTCKTKPDSFGSDDAKFTAPEEAMRIIERNSFFKMLYDDKDDSEAHLVSTSEHALQTTVDAEKMNAIYRRKLVSIRRMSDRRFLKLVSKCELPDEPFFHVVVVKCNDRADCHGLPKNSQLFGVSVPVFSYLDMAPINGRMKIIRIFNWTRVCL